jgi:5'-nucleotidase
MLILLTNDDGIFAPGLLAIYRELLKIGDVHVVAPETVQSATGHGVTLNSPLLTSQVTIDTDVNGQPIVGTAIGGRPADCVKLAVSQILPRRPDLVVSGINSGANVGIHVIYSGTVAAAIEAAFLGLPAIAVSLLLRSNIPTDYARAARDTMPVIEDLLHKGLSPGDVVSINLPALLPDQPAAQVKYCRQCTRPWVDTYDKRLDPRNRPYYWNSSIFTLGNSDADTDVAFLRDGYTTVTPLQFDLTHHTQLALLQGKNEQIDL